MKTSTALTRASPFFVNWDDPFREMERLQRRLDRLDEEMTTNLGPAFEPKCDLEETDSHYLLTVDLPGVKKEDLKLDLRDNVLTISGERKSEHEEKGKERYRTERFYGSYVRNFTVPAGLKAEQVAAEYKDGVLRIALPKVAAAKGETIKIADGKSGLWEKLIGKKEEAKAPAA